MSRRRKAMRDGCARRRRRSCWRYSESSRLLHEQRRRLHSPTAPTAPCQRTDRKTPSSNRRVLSSSCRPLSRLVRVSSTPILPVLYSPGAAAAGVCERRHTPHAAWRMLTHADVCRCCRHARRVCPSHARQACARCAAGACGGGSSTAYSNNCNTYAPRRRACGASRGIPRQQEGTCTTRPSSGARSKATADSSKPTS
jgi:hypothetical protein